MRLVIFDNDFGKLELEAHEDIMLLHCVLHKWSKDLYKEYKLYFENYIVPNLKAQGIDTVWSILPEREIKSIKFNKMFGMKEEFRSQGIVTMSKEI